MQSFSAKNIFTPAADVVINDSRIENYKKILKKNVALRNKFVQDYDELSAGVLMLAELAGINVPANVKARDIISELAVIIERFTENETDLTGTHDLTKPSLSALLSKDNLLDMTTNCVKIFECLTDETEGGGDIQEANGNLWEFIGDLAEAQGIILPEYEP